MRVILHASDNDWLTIVLRQNAADLTMEFFSQMRLAQEWTAIFGREHRMNQDLCQGLRHGHE